MLNVKCHLVFDFILQISMVISLAAIIYLLARAVPRVRDEDLIIATESYFEKLAAKVPIHKIDTWFGAAVAKFLRRLRLIVLKLDNLLHRSITSVNHKHQYPEKNSFIDELNGKE